MAARLCKTCDDMYPDHELFHDCPVCDERTMWKPGSAVPTVHFSEGERRIRYRDGLKGFAEWDKDHGSDTFPVHSATIHSQRRHTFLDREKARLVVDAIQGHPVRGDTAPGPSRPILPIEELTLA